MGDSGQAGSTGSLLFPDRLYEGYVFDLDGTIYLGDDLLPGAKRLIEKLRELGKKVVFLSNNPTKDPQMYAEKLTKYIHVISAELEPMIERTSLGLRLWRSKKL